jgi:hypothetical protein
MGYFLIIGGIVLWYLWASDNAKGEEDVRHKRLIHEDPVGGCIPYIIAFALIGAGIYLLMKN